MALAEDRNLALVEKGPPCIRETGTVESLGLHPVVDALKLAGLIGVRVSGPFMILEPRQYVGAARAAGRSITVRPRSASLFRTLREVAARVPAKPAPTEMKLDPSEEESDVSPAAAFVVALDEAVSEGLPVLYDTVRVTTSTPSGTLRLDQTLTELFSRGLKHVAICDVPRRHQDPALESIVQAAATALADGLQTQFLSRADQLRLDLLSSSLDSHTLESPTNALGMAERLQVRYADWPAVGRLLRISAAVLRGDESVIFVALPAEGGESRFYDMNDLWERACAWAFGMAAGDTTSVRLHPLRNAVPKVALFPDGGPEIDPDIFVRSESHVVVVDAKYSDAQSWSADDVYQVAAYADRVDASVAVLVYCAASSPWQVDVGTTKGGAAVRAFGVAKDDVESSAVAGATWALSGLVAA